MNGYYGPGEHHGRLLPSLLEAAKREDELKLSSGTQRRDFTCVADVAEGLVRLALVPAAVAPEPKIVNLATGSLASVRDFAMLAARVLAIPPTRMHFGAMPTRPEEMEHAEVSIDRLRTLTAGWTPQTTILEGVERAGFHARARSVALTVRPGTQGRPMPPRISAQGKVAEALRPQPVYDYLSSFP